MFDEVRKNPWVRAGAALLALVLVCILLWLLRPVLVPLFFAFLVAYLLDPVVDVFQRMGVRRSITIGILALIGIVLALSIPIFLVPSLIHQAESLIEAGRRGLEDAGGFSGWLNRLVDRLQLETLAEATGCAPDDPNEVYEPLPVLAACLGEYVRNEALGFFQAHGSQIAAAGATAGLTLGRLVSSVTGSIVGAVLFIAKFSLFAFVAAYLLKDYDNIITQAKTLIPGRYRNKTSSIAGKIDLQVRGFVRGQLVVCMCLGTMYAIGLSIAGVPFAVLIGLFGAIASFIPYLGITLTIGPAVILCIVQYGGIDWHLAVVIATFVVAQMLEGTVLTPNIVGDKVGLSPVWVILAILVFGNALGFLGLLLAVPIAASLKVLVVESVEYYKNSTLYKDTHPQLLPAEEPVKVTKKRTARKRPRS